ncbi:MAG: DUF4160 domain-containing protein [Syntrophobacteraceae bacterium]
MIIQMFWADHAPPHFHALYSEFEALNCFVLSFLMRFHHLHSC